MKIDYYLTLFFVLLLSVSLTAQNNNNRPEIIVHIEKSEKISIVQDGSIDNLLRSHADKKSEVVVGPSSTGSGYRVQVFSSNEQRTAKNRAIEIERKVKSVFPLQGVYRTYSSPFWKVRVGDFRTHAEASSFRNELIRAFPELRGESYVVRDSKK